MEELFNKITNNLIINTDDFDESKHEKFSNIIKSWDVNLLENSDLSSFSFINPYFNFNISQNYDIFSNKVIEDFYLLERNLIALCKNLNNSGIIPCLGVYPYIDKNFNNADFINKTEKLIIKVLNECKTYLVVNYEIIKNNNQYLEFVKNLNINNKVILSLNTNSIDENFFTYCDGFINISSDQLSNLDIFSEEVINKKISKLNQYKALVSNKSLNKDNHNLTLKNYVLLENVDEILPLSDNLNIVIIGYNNELVESTIPYVNGYDLENGILDNTKEIIDNNDYVVIIGKINNNTYKLNEYSEELLNYSNQKGKKIIFVLDSKRIFDTSFSDYVNALILGDVSNLKAIEEILYGKFAPCGRLVETYPYDLSELDFYDGICYGYHYYEQNARSAHYPFGYGKSYSTVSFSEYSIEDNDIFFNITNDSNIEFYYVVELYKGNSFENKELFYFESIHLNPNETKTLKISIFNVETQYIYLAQDSLSEIYSFDLGSTAEIEDIKIIPENFSLEENEEIIEEENVEETKEDLDLNQSEENEEIIEEENVEETEESLDLDQSEENEEIIEEENVEETEEVTESFEEQNENIDEMNNNDSLDSNTETEETKESIIESALDKFDLNSNVSFDNIPKNHISAKDSKLELKRESFISKKALIFLTILLNLILIIIGVILIIFIEDFMFVGIALLAFDVVVDILLLISSKVIFRKQSITNYTNEFESLESVEPEEKENIEKTVEDTTTECGNTLKFESLNLVLNNKELDFKTLADSLYQYFLDNKLLIEKVDIYKILSTMFTSKIILLKTENTEYIENFIGILSTFFGTLPFGLNADSYTNFTDLINNNRDFYLFNSNSLQNNNLNICYVNYDSVNIIDFFKSYIPIFNYRDDKILVKNVAIDYNVYDLDTEVSKKIWYFINVSNKDISTYADLINENACLLNIKIQQNNIEDKTDLSIDNINYSYYQVLRNIDSDKTYLSENQWIKLDKIVEFINDRCSFTLTNKLINEIEDYAKVIFEINEELSDAAFDQAISSILIPVIKNLNLSDQTMQDLIKMMEDTFEYDAISSSISVLKTL